MEERRKLLNTWCISLAYVISTTFGIAFMYGMLFYNREMSGGDATQWAILQSAFLFPGAIVNIFVGALSDMFSKKKFMMVSEFASGFAILVLLALFQQGYTSLLYLSLFAAAMSMLYAFFEVPLDASMVNMTDSVWAERLVSIIWLTRAVSYFAGPIIGEIMVRNNSMSLLFYLNAGSFFVSVLLQYIMRYEEQSLHIRDSNVSIRKEIFTQLKELLEYIKENRIIGFLFSLNLVLAIFYVPIFQAITPAIASALDMSNAQLSYVEAASWVGVSLAAIIVAITKMNTFFLKNLFNALKVQGVFLCLWLIPAFMYFSPSILTIGFVSLSIIDGLLNTFQSLGALSYFQIKLPERMRGRVLGTMRTAMKISAPIGIMIYGILLKVFAWPILMGLTIAAMLGAGLFLGKAPIFKKFVEKM